MADQGKAQVVVSYVTVANHKFEKAAVVLDNHSFIDCSFIDCHLFYSGGPVEISGSCHLERIHWHFQGAAALTTAAMEAFGWQISPPTALPPGTGH